MKYFVALLVTTLLALCCSIAFATTYQLPSEFDITGHYCGRPDAPLYKVTGTNPDGTQTGLVWAWTSCSAGGRGSGNSYWSGCDEVLWTLDGQLISYSRIYLMDNRNYPESSTCFGS